MGGLSGTWLSQDNQVRIWPVSDGEEKLVYGVSDPARRQRGLGMLGKVVAGDYDRRRRVGPDSNIGMEAYKSNSKDRSFHQFLMLARQSDE